MGKFQSAVETATSVQQQLIKLAPAQSLIHVGKPVQKPAPLAPTNGAFTSGAPVQSAVQASNGANGNLVENKVDASFNTPGVNGTTTEADQSMQPAVGCPDSATNGNTVGGVDLGSAAQLVEADVFPSELFSDLPKPSPNTVSPVAFIQIRLFLTLACDPPQWLQIRLRFPDRNRLRYWPQNRQIKRKFNQPSLIKLIVLTLGP